MFSMDSKNPMASKSIIIPNSIIPSSHRDEKIAQHHVLQLNITYNSINIQSPLHMLDL